MQKQGKILKLYKKRFKFKKYINIKLFDKIKKKKLIFKMDYDFFFNNIFFNKYILHNNTTYANITNFFFYVDAQAYKTSDFFYKVKINTNKLLLNIYLKNKSIKNNRNSKKKNFEIFLKFMIFFFKKIIINKFYNKISYIFFRIKKNQLKKKIKKKKMIRKKFFLTKWQPYLKKNILIKLTMFISIFNNFFFNKFIKVIPLYNKSHSKNRIKLKKKRRK